MQRDMKQWVDNWKRVGPILEQIKAEELRFSELLSPHSYPLLSCERNL